MFESKNILITGASSGIGAAMAKKFHANGATVILVARRKERLEEIADSLSNVRARVLIYSSDLSQLENVRMIFDYCKSMDKKIDGVVHCAGITSSLPLSGNSIATMENIMHVNVEAFAQILKYISKKKYTNEGASVIAISSTASYRGDRGLAIYSASKAAINLLVKSAAMELCNKKIRVNAIAPAMVRTNMYYESIKINPALENAVMESQPLGLIEPDSLADVADFLMSEKARYITGAVIAVGAGNVF